jgi:hypothetical protein
MGATIPSWETGLSGAALSTSPGAERDRDLAPRWSPSSTRGHDAASWPDRAALVALELDQPLARVAVVERVEVALGADLVRGSAAPRSP